MGLNAASWEVWLPENRKPQSLVLMDDATALVLSTTGLVPMGTVLCKDDVIVGSHDLDTCMR